MLKIIRKNSFKLVFLLSLIVILNYSLRYISAQTQTKSLDLVADPNFSESNLSPDMQVWYKRLWGSINNPNIYPNPTNPAIEGDLYGLGRTTGPYMAILLNAFRITGDLRLLDEADRIMEIGRLQIQDWDNDGYSGWRWLQDPTSSYYGQEYHLMDGWLAYSVVAQHAYVLNINRQHNPVYGEHADFWMNFLKNNWEARLINQKGGLIDKNLMHPYAIATSYYYHTYKLTGETWRLDKVQERQNIINNALIPIDTGVAPAYVWDHRVPNMGDPAFGCQPTRYADLTYLSFAELSLERVGYYDDFSYMQKLMAPGRDLVFKDGYTSIYGDICDSLTVPGLASSGYANETIDKALLYGGIQTMGYWDRTGRMKTLVQDMYRTKFGVSETPRDWNLAGSMLMILAGEEGYLPTISPIVWPSPSATASPEPTIAPTATPQLTPTPTIVPTVTPTPRPTRSPKPTASPQPTKTPKPARN